MNRRGTTSERETGQDGPRRFDRLPAFSRRLTFAAAIGIVFAICASGAVSNAARRANPRGTFTHMYFNPPPNGRVGYHLYSIIHIEGWDTPNGDAPTCSPSADHDNIAVRGTPPPGISFDASGPKFEGTPRQPGTWSVIVDIPGVWCTAGPDLTHYGPRSVTVRFNIAP
jgi:hypothetical protein